MTPEQKRIAELEKELEVTDRLYNMHRKLFEDFPCPKHGPCIPFLRELLSGMFVHL